MQCAHSIAHRTVTFISAVNLISDENGLLWRKNDDKTLLHVHFV